MDLRETKQNTVNTLGNAAEVVSRVIANIAGNDISSRLNGSQITLDSVKDLVMTKFHLNLSRKQK
jgi:hypothetical protein